MAKEFNRVEDLKQLKTDLELKHKCNMIINSLKSYTKAEKFRILTTLYDSFMDICKQEGIVFYRMNMIMKDK